ncbi:hypothetical protein [Streptomyces sp. 351MFTsu5.1]|uniref:hypothetical protein n=1 Tax=Streptomyces sp. 351MFTsu5.1 TaxID=1172180 RepID=UPI000D1188A8
MATREVVGYAMADHHRAELVTDTLDMAHRRAHLEPGRVIHSDRGSEGGFNRSSQHRLLGPIVGARSRLQQESSNRAFSGACC